MKIANRQVGPDHPPLVVAEIGINHGGDLAVAKQMVDAAHSAGCEIVKHQTHFLEDEMTEEAKEIFPPNADVSIWDVMAQCALSADEEVQLKAYAESLGVREAPFLGIPSLNVGTRQNQRSQSPSITHARADDSVAITDFLTRKWGLSFERSGEFGGGDASARFVEIISDPAFWERSRQKTFFESS